jgi:hypothetical protein
MAPCRTSSCGAATKGMLCGRPPGWELPGITITSTTTPVRSTSCGVRIGFLSRRELDFFYRSFFYLPAANLFVIYDQVKARPSTSVHGPYLMHLRWHFPAAPLMSGRVARVVQGASRLTLDTLLPTKPSFATVDERHTPDGCDNSTTPCLPCDGTLDGLTRHCQPWGNDSGTYRLEVRPSGNPLATQFLTTLQAADRAAPAMGSSYLASSDGAMVGAQLSRAAGKTYIVLFNNGPGQTPTPITSVSLQAPPGPKLITLCGMVPGGCTRWARPQAEPSR